MATTAAPSNTKTSTFPLKYFISALAFTWTFWWLALIVAPVIFSHGRGTILREPPKRVKAPLTASLSTWISMHVSDGAEVVLH